MQSCYSSLFLGDSLVLEVISDPTEDVLVSQTRKRPLAFEHLVDILKHGRHSLEDGRFQEFVYKDILPSGF
jgi:hypothetical protein